MHNLYGCVSNIPLMPDLAYSTSELKFQVYLLFLDETKINASVNIVFLNVLPTLWPSMNELKHNKFKLF